MKRSESAGGIVLRDDLVLVVSQHGTSWSLPKGHIEKGESQIMAAKREIYEESGIKDLKLIKKLGVYKRHKISINGKDDKSELKTIYMFLFKTKQDTLKPVDKENPEAKWISKNDVANLLTHKEDKKFFLKVLSQL